MRPNSDSAGKEIIKNILLENESKNYQNFKNYKENTELNGVL